MSKAFPRSRRTISRRRRARLPHQAAGRRAAHPKRHRAARASDHGAEDVVDRAGRWASPTRWRSTATSSADHAGRPGRRRRRDGVRGGRRHRRSRARHPRAAVRPAGGAPARDRRGADAAPRGRLLHPADGARPARHRRGHRHRGWPSRRFRWNRSCSAIRNGKPDRRGPASRAEPVPVHPHHLCDQRGCGATALDAVRADKVIAGRRR